MVSAIPQIVDKPLVCGRGCPGRLSTHRSSIQHGRPTPSHRPALTLARCSALADFASPRVLGAPAASRPSIAHCVCSAPPAASRLPTASDRDGNAFLRFAQPCASLARRSVSSHSPRLRRGCVPPLRTSLCSVSSRLQPLRGLRLRTSCARHFSPSGLHLFASVCIHSSQSSICIARKLACSSHCSLSFLRAVLPTGRALRAPHKKYQK